MKLLKKFLRASDKNLLRTRMYYKNTNDPIADKRQAAYIKKFGIPKPPQNNSLTANKKPNIVNSKNKRINAAGQNKYSQLTQWIENQPRPEKSFLKTVPAKFHSLLLPQKGSFNAALAKYNENKYVMVYRPDEFTFIGCLLDQKFKLIPSYFHKFPMHNVADPRLVWIDKNKLLMTYSAVKDKKEYIAGSIIMDLKKSPVFFDGPQFRISPENLTDRQKNWMPFVHDEKIYLISSVSPHVVYELTLYPRIECKEVYRTDWSNNWPIKLTLRGNTNPILLEDGNYLSTFHTSQYSSNICHYDNGCYIFEGKPPFKVLKSSKTTFLPAEAAVEPHFRKAGIILCTFPIGMLREDNRLLISYGDNDSIVKVLDTTVDDMINLMEEV